MVRKAVDPISVNTYSNSGHNAHANVEIKPIVGIFMARNSDGVHIISEP